MDEIRIDNLEVVAHHGVFEEEKKQGQKFYISAVLKTDFSRAAREDSLKLSTHYGEVCLQIQKTMTAVSYDLIESAATAVAEDILLHFPLIREVSLELRKPSAPIPMKFESVSVHLVKGWHQVYISFGSNMGDKHKYIQDALDKIMKAKEFQNLRVSGFYTSKAYGGVEQDSFLNGVFGAKTYLSPEGLLEYLHSLEKEAGRVRELHWGPRTLDLDILFYDDMILDDEKLQIPHKDMANRDFVLIPLKEIAGFKRHPLTGKTVEEMANDLKESYVLVQ